MKLDESSDFLIRRYLLAAVSEEEREQVETRLMTDDDFFQQISLIEDELIDQYLDGDLAQADQRRFAEFFLRAPERQQKLRFSKALRIYAAQSAAERPRNVEPEPTAWWRSLLALFNPPRPALAYAFLTSLIALAVGGPWAVIRIAGLKGEVSSLQAQQQVRDAGASELRAQVEVEKARAVEIARQLQQEREKGTARQSDAIPVQLAMLNPPPFPLSPGMQRGQSSSSLAIPKDAIVVRLELDLAQNPSPTYRAVLLSEGQEILTRSRLKATESTTAITLRVKLPAADLPGGDYELRLYGAGEKDYMESYVFHVVRK